MEKWIEMDPHFAVDQHQAMFHFAAPCAIMSSAVPVEFGHVDLFTYRRNGIHIIM